MNKRMRILVAYDGSDCANNCIRDLPRAGLPREADAILVNVKEEWLLPPSSIPEVVNEASGSGESTAVRTVRVAEELEIDKNGQNSPVLLEGYEMLHKQFPEWNIERIVLRGSPSYQITRKAKDWDATLVIVGSQGNTEDKIMSLGSVSQKIANEAHCSVRIERGNGWKKGVPSRILIGLDGTHSSQMAVEEVASRMWIMGSEVRIVTAKDPSVTRQRSVEETTRTDAWIDSFIEKASEVLKKSAIRTSQIVEEGDPKRIIIRAADEWGADCIFLGSNDTGSFFENLLLGSVATAVVARAHCSVEVVRDQNLPRQNA